MESRLELRLLGEPEVRRGGKPVELPPSKKTRALLGYLALTRRSHRRERLCALLWDVADDPRAGLRWSLSKLRPVVNDEHAERLVATRDSVELALGSVDVDVALVKRSLADGLATMSSEQLEQAATELDQELLTGLDMSDLFDFQAWLVAERSQLRALRTRVLTVLLERTDLDPTRRVEHAHALAKLLPDDEGAQAALVRALTRTGRRAEAEEAYRAGAQRLQQHGRVPLGELRDALLGSGAAAQPPAEPLPDQAPRSERVPPLPNEQIRFCETPDGVRLAYALCGEGTPVIKTSHWLSHIEAEWSSPVVGPLTRELAAHHRLLRYDQRGTGLSDRNVAEYSVETFTRDLETVADDAGMEKFSLTAVSQGCAIAVKYVVRHPERVDRLVLYGGFATGWAIDASPERLARTGALKTLIEQGWGRENPAFRQTFTTLFIPGASAEQAHSFNELQRLATSPENAARFYDGLGHYDVADLLAQVSVPTLVLHARGDAVVSFKQGRRMAAGIPGARFVPLESENHIVLEHEPAWEVVRSRLRSFLGSQP